MANKKIAIKIDGSKLMEIIKERGYSLKSFVDNNNLSRTERSIRYSIKDNSMPEDLLNEIAYALDIDPSQIRVSPTKISKQELTKKNIKILCNLFWNSTDMLVTKLNLSPADVNDIFSDKPISRDLLDRISKLFPISAEAIESIDLSYLDKNNMKLTAITDNLSLVFPICSSDKAMENPDFAKAYKTHKKILTLWEKNRLSDRKKLSKLMDSLTYYDDISIESSPIEACVNYLSFIFLILFYTKGIELLTHYMNCREQSPAVFDIIMQLRPDIKEEIDKLKNEDFEEEKPFQDLIKDPEYEEELNKVLKLLKKSKKWTDLADYYVALQFVLSAIDNHFTPEQNKEFGFILMSKYKELGNIYAANFLSIL